jgi:hypothetical protein
MPLKNNGPANLVALFMYSKFLLGNMICIAPALLVGLLSGCSWNTYSNGKYSDILQRNVPRETIVAQLGPPASTEYIFAGPYYQKKAGRNVQLRVDRYFTKERIADVYKASGTGMLAGMTLGISELFYAPYSLLDQYIPRTRQLRLIYGEDNTLRNYKLSNSKP